MITQYPNLFFDNSAFNIPIRSKYYKEILDRPLIKRCIHGSDLPVLVSALSPFMRGYLTAGAFKACRKIKNPLEKDYQIKRQMGFPEEVFSRIDKLLSPLEAWKEKKSKLKNLK